MMDRWLCFKRGTVFLSVALASLCCFAAYQEPDSYTDPSKTIKLGRLRGADDTAAFQKAIDQVHERGGGHVVVPAGEYQLAGVVLKSDVHLIFERNVALHAYLGSGKSSGIMFLVGRGDGGVKNVSIRSRESWADVYLPPHERGLRVALFSNVVNFKISGLTIHDHRTVYSSLIFVWDGEDDGTALLPKQGLIEKIVAKNAHYGYGALQVHAGNDLQIRNITAIGGVACRLETGLPQMNLAAFGKPRGYIGLDDIRVEDLISVNGQAALMMEAHTIKHGSVIGRDIKADGSEFAVHLSGGFVSKGKYSADKKYMTIDRSELSPGDFESIAIDGVTATYRDHDIVTRFVHFKDYPEELQSQITQIAHSPYGEPCSRGPSIAAVAIPELHDPSVSITNVSANGFAYHPEIITHADQFSKTLRAIAQQPRIENAPDLPWAGTDVRFESPLLQKPPATAGMMYSNTLAPCVKTTGKRDGGLVFSKLFGPSWLSVVADGSLCGSPSRSDVGENVFTVKVDRGEAGFDIARLQIRVFVEEK